jgi:uncharacterized protein YidB (DUF937 family)
MSLLDSIISAVTGKSGAEGQNAANPLSALLTQNGGLQGLMAKFSQGGLGDIFSSWTGMGENKAISADQIQSLLGSGQIASLATKLGIDPAQASGFLSEHLPKIVDKLTPTGQIDEAADHSAGLAAMMPALLGKFGLDGKPDRSA